MLRQHPPPLLPLGERSGGGEWEFATSEKQASLSLPPEKVTFVNFMSRKRECLHRRKWEEGKKSFSLSMFHSCVTRQMSAGWGWGDGFFPFFRPEFPIFHGSFNAADEDDADAVSKPTRFDSKGGGGGKEEKGGNTQRLYRIRALPQDMHMLQVSWIWKQYAGHESSVHI